MDLITLTIICLGVLSSAAVFESFQQVFQNQKARKKLIEKLEKLGMNNELFESLATKEPNPKTLEEARALINQSLKELNPSEQKHIREGLNQLSPRSQTNYIRKLLEETVRYHELKKTEKPSGCA